MAKGYSWKWLIGGLIITATVIAMAFITMDKFSVYFYTPDEVLAKYAALKDQDVRVGGMVVPGSVLWNPKNLDLTFTVSDLKESHISVTYRGAPPDMFKENGGVIVEGKLQESGHKLAAKKLIVKHSEEYRAPHDKSKFDPALIEKSILKAPST